MLRSALIHRRHAQVTPSSTGPASKTGKAGKGSNTTTPVTTVNTSTRVNVLDKYSEPDATSSRVNSTCTPPCNDAPHIAMWDASKPTTKQSVPAVFDEHGIHVQQTCGTPGCTLPDFHEGLCSNDYAPAKRNRLPVVCLTPGETSFNQPTKRKRLPQTCQQHAKQAAAAHTSRVERASIKLAHSTRPSHIGGLAVCAGTQRAEAEAIDAAASALGLQSRLCIADKQLTSDCTHVLVHGSCSTLPFGAYLGVAKGAWVLRTSWVFSSLEAGHWLPEESFEATDLGQVREARLERGSAGGGPLCEFTVCFWRATYLPHKTLGALVRAAGGQVSTSPRTCNVIVTDEAQKMPLSAKLQQRSGVGPKVVGSKWVFDTICKSRLAQSDNAMHEAEANEQQIAEGATESTTNEDTEVARNAEDNEQRDEDEEVVRVRWEHGEEDKQSEQEDDLDQEAAHDDIEAEDMGDADDGSMSEEY
eukprot:CAMPEP_0119306664 /NCGR_PEP_ID=MMETSP1333-20130426/7360_1 /TAXON_ID=418940 /ORGANISM="Scyphosphaera apsteinii, Strain RCC1455" /LENGTH=472 /DNA_ID=CAMNT_0007310021 /DNA_START=33 /DNA_END=1451 /DNA_ORIENTATION=+